ncbi:hypothetical protein RclHR1_05020009 [Rhizophagus clarus]|uniref:Mating-type m-specific polypeptide mc n=1 Tax=Rhizophagus clarus TaxID=94130 RepID=A0A2Z6S3G8_9GLOM|nr:hypothetical protein RclHR1_05020009 [Rhizophagus clarus]GET04292.1 mating-type m-specific polypeptide mc [Rhizophagus clarus]
MPRLSKPTSSLYNPYENNIEVNRNGNFEIPFIFQDYRHSSSSTISSIKDCLNENFDTLITRLKTNPPYKLTLTIEELLAPSKRKRSKSSSKSPPPRPQNVFILFKRDLTARLRLESQESLTIVKLSKLAKATWENLSNEVRQFFQILYLACIEKHKQLYPGYRYSPKKRRQSGRSKNRSNAKEQVSVFPTLNYDDLFLDQDMIMNKYFDFRLWDSHHQQ